MEGLLFICCLFVVKGGHELLHGSLVAKAGAFTDAVHSKHRAAKIDGFDASGCFGQRANGGAAAHVGAVSETLYWQIFVGTEGTDHGFAARCGGVAMIGRKF